MADIYSFLGVADDFLPKVGAVHNPSGRPRRKWLQQFLMESNLLKTGLKRLVPPPLRRNFRRWLLKTNLQKTALDPHMRHRLMELYREGCAGPAGFDRAGPVAVVGVRTARLAKHRRSAN